MNFPTELFAMMMFYHSNKVLQTQVKWKQILIEDMVQEIGKDFTDETEVKKQVSRLNVKRVGLLQDYTLDELKAKGIESSVATAIIKFIEKQQPATQVMPWQEYGQYIDGNKWKEDARSTRIANELLKNEEIELGAGVRMIKLSAWFQNDAGESPILFTTRQSRALWEEVYQ